MADKTNSKQNTASLSEPVTRGEFIDFKDEMSEFKQAFYVLFETQRREFERHIGALGESLKGEIRMVAEALKMHAESSDRRWAEQKEENYQFNKRLYQPESKQSRA